MVKISAQQHLPGAGERKGHLEDQKRLGCSVTEGDLMVVWVKFRGFLCVFMDIRTSDFQVLGGFWW